jgi:hypothetical protein
LKINNNASDESKENVGHCPVLKLSNL